MKLALIQMSSVTGELKGNLERIKKEIGLARNKGSDLVVFPEMALTGYCISDLVEDDLFVMKNKFEKIKKLVPGSIFQILKKIIILFEHNKF